MNKVEAVIQKFAKLIFVLFVALIVTAAGVSWYYYHLYQKSKSAGPQQETQQLIDTVGKIIELPTGEQPTIATVADKSKLAGNPFFAHAENGDKVLIYEKAKKAFLYRPSNDKIIEVGPININNSQAAGVATSSATLAPMNVALYNGSMTTGLTLKVEKLLQEKQPHVKVVDKENASRNDYEHTIVVDLTGKHKDAAQTLAHLVSGSVSSLPPSEATPSADILIILGADYKE